MADSRFFKVEGPFTLAELAEIAGGEISDGADPHRQFTDVAPLDKAGPADLSFLDNKRYLPAFEVSQAGACIVLSRYAERSPPGMSLILSPQPYRAYALVAQAFYPKPAVAATIHETAVLDPTASIGEGVSIGPYAVIGEAAEIGARCRIAAHAVIESGVVVGEDTEIGANASLSHCLVGDRCQIHSGARIGNRGFGFALAADGYVDVPQLGRVIIEDDVEIGANTTIDRGSGPDTLIGRGTKIDNLIQIGHNVQIGKGCVLVAQSGVAGSSMLGEFVMLGAQGGIAGHLKIGDGAQIAAQSGVMRDVPAGQSICGAPAIPIREFFRLNAMWQRQLKASRKSND